MTRSGLTSGGRRESASILLALIILPLALIIIPVALILLSPAAAPAAEPGTTGDARRLFDESLGLKLAPMLCEAIRFPTVAGNDSARARQEAWLREEAAALGFTVRNAGKVTEIELAGPADGPVLGLVVHGDVQPVDSAAWSIPPFAGVIDNGYVLGRGAADDKGPLVQALLAMEAIKLAGPPLTHTVRLLVGSDEESANTDMTEYLASHEPPDYSLVLDYRFPVVVGEKAWNALYLDARPGATAKAESSAFPYDVVGLEAGLSPSIVPDFARLTLHHRDGEGKWRPIIDRFVAKTPPEGTRIETMASGSMFTVTAKGKAAHGGVNLEGGRNALVALARVAEGELPPCGERDLLAFARLAGEDLYGSGLGLTRDDPIWGRFAVNVATVKPVEDGALRLTIVLRRPPTMSAAELEAHLGRVVGEFNARTGARLVASGFYDDEPVAFDPKAKIVRRLLAAYARATGDSAKPVIAGGGTYAKRLPNSIAFGMWFPGTPYPGHDVDEKIPVEDLSRGTHVLIEALADLACGKPLIKPFKP